MKTLITHMSQLEGHDIFEELIEDVKNYGSFIVIPNDVIYCELPSILIYYIDDDKKIEGYVKDIKQNGTKSAIDGDENHVSYLYIDRLNDCCYSLKVPKQIED